MASATSGALTVPSALSAAAATVSALRPFPCRWRGLRLVADDAPWNGDSVENAEALTIRARDVDHAMVMATLQMMKDAQWEEVLRAEARNDSKVVKKTVRRERPGRGS